MRWPGRSGPRRPASWLSPGASPTGFSRDFLRRRVAAEPDGEAFLDRLTTRERDILRLLADGLGDRDIATALTISRRTVESHVSSILRKLEVRNRAEAARRYRDEL